MRKHDWPYLILGLLLTTTPACRPITEEDPNVVMTDAPATVAVTVIAGQATITPTPPFVEPTPTATPIPTIPPRPTAVPTQDPIADWQTVGDPTTGLQIAVPPDWINLSPELDVSVATSQLGLTTLFVVEAPRTGESLLSGKEIDMGAFVMGVMMNEDLPPDSPRSSLTMLLSRLAVDTVGPIAAITADSPSGTVVGVTTDVLGDPVGIPIIEGQDFQIRLLLFLLGEDAETNLTTQVILLMGASADDWTMYEETFGRIDDTVVVYKEQTNFALGGGSTNIVGDLHNALPVQAILATGVKDVWAFAGDARYATLTLSTDVADLDLRLTVFDISGQVVAAADNGYTGDTEIAADIVLATGSRYFVEVDEFFDNSGRYSLTLNLTDEPLYSGGGQILPGQTIQSMLPPGQHLWSFAGTAGQTVSIVLVPADEQLDAILDLYGPDGRRLAALDEGFSGDAEVISGFSLPVTGEYTILVRSFADAGGEYSLSLDEGGEVTQNFYEAGDLVYGDVRQESLQPLEAHAWYFTGKAGDDITVKVMPLDPWLDLDVWLLDANVERLAAQDEFLAGESETVAITLPADGQYVILIRDFFAEAGRYEITLEGTLSPPPVYAGNLTYGETALSSLTAEAPDLWLFDGVAGDVINIQLLPAGNVDFLFVLQKPDGTRVTQVDSASLGNAELLSNFTLTADGSWRIIVETFFEEGGSYSLRLDRAE